MRSPVILNFIGSFLKVYGVLLMVPLIVYVYYSGALVAALGFVLAATTSMVLGFTLRLKGKSVSPSVSEAMLATVLGWILATVLGAIPMLPYLSYVNALFEASAGLTTTGITMLADPSILPRSVLFWRSFMQWIGGLGILTFFIAVVRESGGASRRLFSAEAHKTDAGSIRPSLMKSVSALWRVYGFLTLLIATTFIAFRVPIFESFLHSFSTISTGGFSTEPSSIAAYGSLGLEAFVTFFMFVGGVNFVLLHRFLRSEFSQLMNNSEFRLYLKITVATGLILAAETFVSGASLKISLLDGFFQAASITSSTGFSTVSFAAFSATVQLLLVAVMFVGGSLGSTAGGLKIFRLKTLLELLRTRLKSYGLPQSAINEVKIDGEIVESSAVRTISVLFFSWGVMVFASSIITMALNDISLMGALSGSVSSASNMGPVFAESGAVSGLSPLTKISWSVLMIAGRLEMLPVLAIFNSELLESTG